MFHLQSSVVSLTHPTTPVFVRHGVMESVCYLCFQNCLEPFSLNRKNTQIIVHTQHHHAHI